MSVCANFVSSFCAYVFKKENSDWQKDVGATRMAMVHRSFPSILVISLPFWLFPFHSGSFPSILVLPFHSGSFPPILSLTQSKVNYDIHYSNSITTEQTTCIDRYEDLVVCCVAGKVKHYSKKFEDRRFEF